MARRLLGAALLLPLLLAPLLLGATPSHEDDPEANLPFLFAVYTITWVVFFIYVFFMSRKQQELHREIEGLRQALEEQERSGDGPAGTTSGASQGN